MMLLVVGETGAWAQTTFKTYLSEGFEGSTTLSGSSCTASNSDATANATARTGSKVCYAYPSSASGSGRYVTVGSSLTADNNYYIHAIVWVKGDNIPATNDGKVAHQIGPYGSSPADNYVNTTTSYTRCTITPKKSGGSSKAIRLYFISNNGTPVSHFWYDDFIMYLSSANVPTDLTAPSQATSASGTTSTISWTNGSDGSASGATGIQKTLIFHRTGGSNGSNDLSLNDQGIYSLTSTEGPSVVGNWTLVTASVAADATSYEGTFTLNDEYAIVHRDLAYNYSTPTYFVVNGAGKTTTTTAISSTGITNLDLKNGTSAGTLTATVTPEGESALDNPTITWSSDDETIATVGETTGEVSLVAVGTAHIKATYAGDSNYSGSNDTYEIVVTDSRVDPELSYGTPIVNKVIGDAVFVNALTNDNGVTITYSISNNGTGSTIDENTGEVTVGSNQGTETITATSSATSTYKSGKATYTLNVGMSAVSNKFWDFSDWTAGSFTSTKASDNIELVAASENGMEIATNSSQTVGDESFTKRLKLNGAGASTYRYVHFKVAPKSQIYVYQYSGHSDRELKVYAGSFNGTKLLEEGTTEYKKSICAYTGNEETDIYIYSGSSNISIYGIKVEPMKQVTITAAGYATFSSTEKLDFTNVEGLTAYKATTTSESSVTLEDVTGIVPAETGLLLKGDAATYYIPVSTADATANVTGNKLQSTATAAHDITNEELNRAFVFGKLGEEVGFFKAAEGKTIGVGKSYLLLDAAPAKDVEFLSFVFGDEEQGETDGIKAVSTNVENGVRYNLAGQKVGADYKGIVIVNGKKYLRK